MDFIDSFLGRNGFLPHGVCLSSSPTLLWSMVVANGLIAAAYFSIPLAIWKFTRQRTDVTFPRLAWLFGAFIFACGLTHVMHIWTLWWPAYALQLAADGLTAVLSIVTAVALWRLIPVALEIPSVGRLRSVIASLEAEVAQRRSAEDQLAEVQSNLAATLASIGAGFIATDRAGHVTRMNSVAEQILGWTELQAQGQSVWQVFERENRPADFLSRNPVDVMLAQGYSIEVGYHITAISRQGVRTPVEVKAALTHAADGSVRGIAVVFRDLSRIVLAEANSARLAAIVESSNDAIIGKTLDGRITSWNPAAQALFGYSAQEAIGQRVQMLIPEDRQVEEMRILAMLAHGARVEPFETVRRARDGRLFEVSLSISPIRNERGQIIGASKIARDISAQRLAEQALRDSESQLHFALESAQIGEWTLDLDTGVIQRSIRHDRCYGYTVLRSEWTRAITLAHVHPDDRATLIANVNQAIASLGDLATEYRVNWADGSTHWLRVSASVRHEGGVATRLVGVVMDVTVQRQAEQARVTAQRLEAENRQIQAASQLKSQFLANMSHELRTPLNAIIGFADLLSAGRVPLPATKQREYLGHIGNSGRHLLQLINDVLDLSKIEAGKFDFYPEPVALPAVVAGVVDVLHAGALGKGLNLRTHIDAELQAPGALMLDAGRLKQVLYNYLSNAIKFTPVGGTVTVRALVDGPQQWRLEVEDTGIGIDAQDLKRLFQDFQQLESGYNKTHQGTGLGLALTRRLVEAQGGSVGARSQPGVGSVFHLRMARQPQVLADATPGQVQPTDAVDARNERVLVIEGDERQQHSLIDALRQVGLAADVAGTAQQALNRAASQPYRAITLDLALPGSGGLPLLGQIRHDSASSETPVVGLSLPVDADSAAPGPGNQDPAHNANTANPAAARYARFPVADVLFKPLHAEQVGVALARLCQRQPEPARVLVIDDDPLALRLMHDTLLGLGITALCVTDARQALHDLPQHRPDAIVLDLMMPGFDGFATLDALGAMPAWREVPVYIWTSMMLTDEEFRLLTRSARAILNKGGGTLEPLLESLRALPALRVDRSSPAGAAR